MKLYSAISPSMNDQWSGKTLRRFFFIAVPRPSRSSTQLATPPSAPACVAVAAWVRLLRTNGRCHAHLSHAPRSSVRRVR